MKNYRELKNERKSRNKGIWYSIGFHAIIFGLLLMPFFNSEVSPPAYEDVVIVDFSSASSMKGASGSSSAPQKIEVTERKTHVVEKMSTTLPPKILTQDESPVKVVKIKTPPTRIPEEFKRAPEKLETSTKEGEISSSKQSADIPVVNIPLPKKEGGGASVGDKDTGTSGVDGVIGSNEGGVGNSDSGVGKSDTGEGKDNGGDGLFGEIGELKRSVIYRPDVSKMIRENSTIKVRVCISRDGRVVDYAYEPEGSYVNDPSLIKETLKIFSKYKFEPVRYGPVLECGVYTIRVDMSKL